MAMVPDEQGIFYVLVVSGGPGAGEFIYDASGNLRSSNVGQVTTDPVQGITCQQGFATYNGHGAVINLLSTSKGAFFQYQDLGTSSQGLLILVVASTASTDPVNGFAYQAGMTGVDPAFGDSITTVGANIGLAQVAYTRNANIAAAAGGGATQPKLQLDAPEQTTASHLQMWMTGGSPDATKVAQLILGAVAGAGVLAPSTTALLEVQGTIQTTALASIIANGNLQTTLGDIIASAGNLLINTVGKGLRVKEGLNGKQGTALLSAGTATVNNTNVTAASRIFLTAQDNLSTGALRVSARTAGTSFTITSSNAGDSGSVAWEIFEPA